MRVHEVIKKKKHEEGQRLAMQEAEAKNVAKLKEVISGNRSGLSTTPPSASRTASLPRPTVRPASAREREDDQRGVKRPK
jgi:hypothetical protein